MVEESIFYQLNTITELGKRIYPVVGIEESSNSYATLQQTGEEEQESLSGEVLQTESDYAINIFASTYTETKQLKVLVKAALEAMYGETIEEIYIKKIKVRRETAEFWEPNLGLFGKQINFTITY